MNIATLLRKQAQVNPTVPAIVDNHQGGERVTTFEQLEQDAQHAAGMFRAMGLKAGDCVLVFVPMSAELYTLLSAIFRAGLVAMFLDPSAGRKHIERCCEIVQPRAFVAIPKAHLLRLVSPAIRRIGHHLVVGRWCPGTIRWSDCKKYAPVGEIAVVTANTPALITFTSGSTGLPKAAVRRHGFLLAQHQALAESIHLVPGQIDLGTLPIFTLANLASGVTTVIPNADLRAPGLIAPEPVVNQVERLKITRVTASPALLERMADYCIERDRHLATLTQIFTGGAPVFPRLLDKLHRMAPEAKVCAVYGSTEAEPIAQVAREDISESERAGMVAGQGLPAGRPEECIQLRILRQQWGTPVGPLTGEQLSAMTEAAGRAGEIIVSGEHVLPGYLNGMGDAQTKIHVDGRVWHRTGDAGYLDGNGCLWLLGRCEGRIQDEHGTLYPFAVETAVMEYEGVKRAALIANNGKRVLVVELALGAKPDLREAIKRQLAWAHLEHVLVVPQIPVDKRHNAKVDYPALRKLLAKCLPM